MEINVKGKITNEIAGIVASAIAYGASLDAEEKSDGVWVIKSESATSGGGYSPFESYQSDYGGGGPFS